MADISVGRDLVALNGIALCPTYRGLRLAGNNVDCVCRFEELLFVAHLTVSRRKECVAGFRIIAAGLAVCCALFCSATRAALNIYPSGSLTASQIVSSLQVGGWWPGWWRHQRLSWRVGCLSCQRQQITNAVSFPDSRPNRTPQPRLAVSRSTGLVFPETTKKNSSRRRAPRAWSSACTAGARRVKLLPI